MNIKIFKNPPDYDHDDVVWVDKDGKETGSGYQGKDDKRLLILRCPICHKENYAMAIASGKCCWCSFDANK